MPTKVSTTTRCRKNTPSEALEFAYDAIQILESNLGPCPIAHLPSDELGLNNEEVDALLRELKESRRYSLGEEDDA